MRPYFSKGVYRGRELRLRIERLGDEFEPVALTTPRLIYEFMRDVGSESAERMYSLLLDTTFRLNGIYEVGKGSVDTCHAEPKEVFKAALVTNSPSFALVHNHPSGVVEPSRDDAALLGKLLAGSQLLGVNIVDFMVIGDRGYYSASESGCMSGRSG